MNASEMKADMEGDGTFCQGCGRYTGCICQAPPEQSAIDVDWVNLPQEPCRFCHAQGGVWFKIDEGPEGRGSQPVRCDKCKRTWQVDSSSA